MLKKYSSVFFYLKNILLTTFITIIAFFINIPSYAQSLSAGDIAFIEYNADSGGKNFAFVALTNIPANDIIYFTDNEENDLTGGEGTITWTSPAGGVSFGTVVRIYSTPSANYGSVSETNDLNFATGGDGVIAYQGSAGSPTFITALGNDGSSAGIYSGTKEGNLPSGLTLGLNAQSISEIDNAKYNGTLMSGNKTTLLNSIYNYNNWVRDDAVIQTFSAVFLINWDGSDSSDWSVGNNWDSEVAPNNYSTINVSIPSGLSSYPTASSAVTVNSVTMNSGSSLIAQSTFSGNITYNRTLSTTNWYLISSPVVGETIDDLISNHTFDTGSGSNIGLSTYTTSNDSWSYMISGSSGSISSGNGYAVKLNSAGDISFTGTMKVDDTSIALTTSGNGYNLIGNPYPSYINSGSILPNSTSALSAQTMWVWNSSTGSYDTKVTANAFKIAPGQGFFVKSDGDVGNILIDEDDQSHQASDTFQRTEPRPEIGLTLSNDSASRQATIYYIDGTTTGFDNGYDGEMFAGVANEFAIYTHFLTDSEGQDLAIQSLPDNNYENMIIPLGINAISETDITIDASISNFPEGMNVYLEDKEDDSFTLLDGDSNFTTTLTSDVNGIGRFYLHTTSETLSSDDLLNNTNISIYASSKENLRVVGVQNGTANIHIYNILGKEVLRSYFEGAVMNDIQLPNLAEGVYIVNLSTTNGTINKKIIIQ